MDVAEWVSEEMQWCSSTCLCACKHQINVSETWINLYFQMQDTGATVSHATQQSARESKLWNRHNVVQQTKIVKSKWDNANMKDTLDCCSGLLMTIRWKSQIQQKGTKCHPQPLRLISQNTNHREKLRCLRVRHTWLSTKHEQIWTHETTN